MTLPSLSGPPILSDRIADQTIGHKVPSVYVLSAGVAGVVTTRRVGRTNDDRVTGIKVFVGLCSDFSCAVASSPKDAHEMACELYHARWPPENVGASRQGPPTPIGPLRSAAHERNVRGRRHAGADHLSMTTAE